MSEFVTGQYDPRARDYVQSAVHASGADLDHMAALVKASEARVVLDLGCGGGHVSYAVAPHVDRVVAYDPTRSMARAVQEEAHKRGLAPLSPVCGYAESLPFADSSFDAVLSRFSAHHWADLETGLSEWRRVLRHGGTGILVDTVAPENAMADSVLQTIETLRDPSHMRNYKVSEWCRLLAAAGFQVEAVTNRRLRLDFVPWVARTKTPDLHQQAILSLQRATSPSVREMLEIDEDGSFTLDTALFVLR